MPVFLISSCSSDDESKDKTMSLSMNLGDVSAQKRFKQSHIKVNQVKLLVARIKYHGASDADSLDFETGPVVVVIDSGATLKEISSAQLPKGTYKKVSFKIHKPDDNETVSDSEFTTGGRYSMIIKGEADGVAFTLKFDKTMKEELRLDPPVEINDESSSYIQQY